MEDKASEEMVDGEEERDDESVSGSKVGEVGSDNLRILEALLFASNELLTAARIKEILPGQIDARQIRKLVEKINVQLQKERHPFEIVEIGGGYQFRTVAYYHPWVRQIFKEKASKKLSVQALECLAIISYRQPISKAEIEAVRGVISDGAMKTLLEKRLITISGRSDKPGRPLLYSTTQSFLKYFGLNKVEDLPRIEEFEAIVREKMEDLAIDELDYSSEGDLDEETLFTESSVTADSADASMPRQSSLPVNDVVAASGGVEPQESENVEVVQVPEPSASDADDEGTAVTEGSEPVVHDETSQPPVARFTPEDVAQYGGALLETTEMHPDFIKKLKRSRGSDEPDRGNVEDTPPESVPNNEDDV